LHLALAGYVLFWAVLHARGNHAAEYQLLAMVVYIALATVHLLFAISCLVGGIQHLRFVMYALKTACAAACAMYAGQLRKSFFGKSAGAARVAAAKSSGAAALPSPARPRELI
jgi:hypothetical protein